MTPEEGLSNPIVERPKDLTASTETDSGQALRKRAEALAGERAGERTEDLEARPLEVALRALHELRVHQNKAQVMAGNHPELPEACRITSRSLGMRYAAPWPARSN
jgi:hypothetical protein